MSDLIGILEVEDSKSRHPVKIKVYHNQFFIQSGVAGVMLDKTQTKELFKMLIKAKMKRLF